MWRGLDHSMAGIYWFRSDFVSVRQTKPEKEAPKESYTLYLCPQSKCWMRAHGANVQHAATNGTDKGYMIFFERLLNKLRKFMFTSYSG